MIIQISTHMYVYLYITHPRKMGLGGLVLGSLILYLKGMRMLLFKTFWPLLYIYMYTYIFIYIYIIYIYISYTE